jgi:predicted DNA-binding transcriptional regulator AlpA
MYLLTRDIIARGFASNRVTLYRRIKAGWFPKPIRLGPNQLGWTEDQLREFAASGGAPQRRRPATS